MWRPLTGRSRTSGYRADGGPGAAPGREPERSEGGQVVGGGSSIGRGGVGLVTRRRWCWRRRGRSAGCRVRCLGRSRRPRRPWRSARPPCRVRRQVCAGPERKSSTGLPGVGHSRTLGNIKMTSGVSVVLRFRAFHFDFLPLQVDCTANNPTPIERVLQRRYLRPLSSPPTRTQASLLTLHKPRRLRAEKRRDLSPSL